MYVTKHSCSQQLQCTDEYRACIWTNLGEFRYQWYESVYITLLNVKVFYYPIETNLS